MKTINIAIVSAIITLSFYSIGKYFEFKDDKVCGALIIMNDGSQIDGTEIYSEENGMTTIRQCNGEEIRIPTINIKMVKHIEK